MSFQAEFQWKSNKDSPFQVELCMFCQKALSQHDFSINVGRAKKKNVSDFQNFIDTCKKHYEYGTGLYAKLYDTIKDKTAHDLLSSGFDYHSSCRRTFNRDAYNLERKEKCTKRPLDESLHITQKERRLTRSQIDPFDVKFCLFCQESDNDSLHNVMQDSMDIELKLAFEECPNDLEIFRIRWEGAFDAMAREIKYHRHCWNRYIRDRIPEIRKSISSTYTLNSSMGDSLIGVGVGDESIHLETVCSAAETSNSDVLLDMDDTTENSVNPVLQHLILLDIARGVELAIADNQVLTIRNVIDVYKNRLQEHGVNDLRDHRALRKLIKRFLLKNVQDISFETYSPNESQRITSKNLSQLIFNLAERKAKENDEELGILRHAAEILRRRLLAFRKNHPVVFKARPETEECNVPNTLFFFYKWLLAGNRKLGDKIDTQIAALSNTMSQNVLFNIRSDRQATYNKPKGEIRPRHMYTPIHQICLGLSLRHSDRNNVVLNMLSAPNYGYSITPRQCLKWETSIANTVIKNMELNNGVYIPPAMVKEVVPMFHLDNIDWLEDTPDGKNTTHYLILSIFQRSQSNTGNYSLEIDQDTPSLKLLENTFGLLLPHEKPVKNMFKRTKGSSEFQVKNVYLRGDNIRHWLLVRSLEYLFRNNASIVIGNFFEQDEIMEVSCNNEEPNTELHDPVLDFDVDNEKGESNMPDTSEISVYHDPLLPSFAALNSLIKDIDLGITNIFTIPLIPGPASSYSAIYTALMKAQGITIWTCSSKASTIVSLDLDLFEKAYQLVNIDDTLRGQFVLCLGELHIVFAHIRAIGSFLNSSGIDEAWMAAGWYDSGCLIREVLECGNMKRALEAHEASLLTINHLLIESVFNNKTYFYETHKKLLPQILELRAEVEKQNGGKESFKKLWDQLRNDKIFRDLDDTVQKFVEHKKKDKMFLFLMLYSNMIRRLLLFIEASRVRNWEQHLAAAEDLIPDLAAMNRLKYRRLMPVYIADMYHLRESDPIVWNALDKDFSCQKSNVPGTAIGRDHCGEQVNRCLKTRGGLTGITRNENSRTRQLLVAPVLSSIFNEMSSIGGMNPTVVRKHHQLNTPYIKRQNDKVRSLLEVFKKHNVLFDIDEERPIKNMITGQVFTDHISSDILQVEQIGKQLYNDFVEERMQPNSSVSIFAPLRKCPIKTFKSSNKSQTMKINDKVVELKENCNLFARCAVIQGTRNIDMIEVVGHYELTVAPPSLFRRDGSLLDGFQGKSKLVEKILDHVKHESVNYVNANCIVIDAMFLLNQMNPKPTSVKNGKDLAEEFLKRIYQISSTSSFFIIVFDQYLPNSMKSLTREKRGEKVARYFKVSEETSLEKIGMSELLSNTNTKSSLVNLLIQYCKCNIVDRQYIIAGNNKTECSYQQTPLSNNHEEADTLMIYCLTIAPINESDKVLVYANDTDVFTLLLKHHDKLKSKNIYMKGNNSIINVSFVFFVLGERISSSLLSLHALTGCDTIGKFSGKSKEFWVKQLLEQKVNHKLIDSLLCFQEQITNDVYDELEKFVCYCYLPRKSAKLDLLNFASTRYFLFIKFNGENDKLPPTLGTFKKHVSRAFYQLSIWNEASKAHITTRNAIDYGWIYDDAKLVPATTDMEIAPKAVIELVACNCGGTCSNLRCKCKKNNVSCTDFCGCDSICENIDVRPSDYVTQEMTENESITTDD